jgi:uncharacterized membrane protein YkvA (DUF1232 family)
MENKLLNELIGRKGFTELPVTQLFKQAPFVDIVTEKINSLDTLTFCEQELQRDVRLLLEVVRETLAGRYPHLSILAFAHILVALDHFVRVKDTNPDTTLGGYLDDLLVVREVLREFRSEVDQFAAWKARVQDKDRSRH